MRRLSPPTPPPAYDSYSALLRDLRTLRKLSRLSFEQLAAGSVKAALAHPELLPYSKPTFSRFLAGSGSERQLETFVVVCVRAIETAGAVLPASWNDRGWWHRRWAAVGPGSELRLESQDATWEGDALGLPYGFPGVLPTVFWGNVGSAAHQLVERMRTAGRNDDPEGAVELADELTRRCPEGPGLWAARQAAAYWAAEAGLLRKARQLTSDLLRAAREELGPEAPFTLLTMRRLADREAELGNHRNAVCGYETVLLGSPGDESRPDQLLARLGWARSMAERGHSHTAYDALGRLLPVVRGVFGPQHPARLRTELELVRVRAVLSGAQPPGPGEYVALRRDFETVFGDGHRYTALLRATTAEQLTYLAVHAGDRKEARAQREVALGLWERSRAKRQHHPVTLALGLLGASLSLCDQALLDSDHVRLQARTQAVSLCEIVVHDCVNGRAALGNHHPYEAAARSVLGALLPEHERHREAVEHLLSAVSIFRRTLGAEHPETLASLAALVRTAPAGQPDALCVPLAQLLDEESQGALYGPLFRPQELPD
ncbi:hypothetical protein [Streptomyces sp. NBC_00887]|uniref:hypothetical protein n=1 Tax=Streptomyces sp. NBC_00887 TaxID=2975859 RepID=UPI00386BE935|nr:tetratricopeptide repeat protein [Streptomyces sp. NBC_00887]